MSNVLSNFFFFLMGQNMNAFATLLLMPMYKNMNSQVWNHIKDLGGNHLTDKEKLKHVITRHIYKLFTTA